MSTQDPNDPNITPRRRLAILINESKRYQFHPTAAQVKNRLMYGFFDFVTDDRLNNNEILISEDPDVGDRFIMCRPEELSELRTKLAAVSTEYYSRRSRSASALRSGSGPNSGSVGRTQPPPSRK